MSQPTAKQVAVRWKRARKKLRDAQVSLIEAHAYASTYLRDPGTATPPVGWLTDAAVRATAQALGLTDIADMTRLGTRGNRGGEVNMVTRTSS